MILFRKAFLMNSNLNKREFVSERVIKSVEVLETRSAAMRLYSGRYTKREVATYVFQTEETGI